MLTLLPSPTLSWSHDDLPPANFPVSISFNIQEIFQSGDGDVAIVVDFAGFANVIVIGIVVSVIVVVGIDGVDVVGFYVTAGFVVGVAGSGIVGVGVVVNVNVDEMLMRLCWDWRIEKVWLSEKWLLERLSPLKILLQKNFAPKKEFWSEKN